MYRYKCPHCGASGASQRRCKYCLTTYCTVCKKTVAGDSIGVGSMIRCHVCKNKGKVYYVDYKQGSKCS